MHLLESGFLPYEAKCVWLAHSGHYCTSCSHHFHFWNFCYWQVDYQFPRRLSDVLRLVIQFISLPRFAENHPGLAIALAMSLSWCLEIYCQSYQYHANLELLRLFFIWNSDWVDLWKSNVATLKEIPIWPVKYKPSTIIHSGSDCSSASSSSKPSQNLGKDEVQFSESC